MLFSRAVYDIYILFTTTEEDLVVFVCREKKKKCLAANLI